TFQLLKDRQQLENTAVEQLDSQESSEFLLPPSNTSSTSLRDGEAHAEDMEGQDKAMLETLQHLLSPNREALQTNEVGGDFVTGENMGGATAQLAAGDDSGVKEEERNTLQHLSDDSMERADGMTFHLHGFHGDEAELELAL
ncbi:hypothetical protein ILYODFUR_037618, partial [Ilyodon furcidens]